MPVQDIEETAGQRVARLRKLRGLTQHGLAARSHVSRSLIAKVERGHSLATPAFISAVSTALAVDPAEISGHTCPGRGLAQDRIHATIPQVRRALDSVDVPSDPDVRPRPMSMLVQEIESLRLASKNAEHLQIGTRLPALLTELAVHAHSGDDPRTWRHVNAAQALAVSLSRRLGYTDLAMSAIKDAAASAARSDDPNLPALAQLSRALMMMMYGSWVVGLHIVRAAASSVDQDTPRALAVHGALQLRSAVLSARGTSTGSTTPGDAWEYFGRAEETVRRLPGHTRDWYALQFNPANVQIHGCAVAVEMGDHDEALRRDALVTESVLASLPAARRAHHDIDMARALVEAGKREKALARLAAAERIAPQMTRYHPSARAVTAHLIDLHRSVPEPLRGLARRMQIS